MRSCWAAEYPILSGCMPTYRYYGGHTCSRTRWRRGCCRRYTETPAVCAVRHGSGEDEKGEIMKRVLGLSIVLAIAPASHAADIEAGKAKVIEVCSACHGLNGVSVSDTIPNLAGQRAAYLESQLRAFKDGARKP